MNDNYPPTTLQSVFPVADQRFDERAGGSNARCVCWEPENALSFRERTRSRTARTFHQSDATVGKPFGVDGNLSNERTVTGWTRVLLFFHRFALFRRVLWLAFRDGLPFRLFPIHTCWFYSLPICDKRAWPISLNEDDAYHDVAPAALRRT
jgi:hypothetical protein